MKARFRRFQRTWPRPVWILLAGWVVNATGFGMVVPFMSIYFNRELGIPMRYVALLFLATAVVRAVSGVVGGRLSDNIGRKPLLILGPAGRGTCFFIVAYLVSRHAPFLATASVLVGTFFLAGTYQPVAQAVVADVVPEDRRLQAYAWTRVAMNLGWAIGPALGGYISEVSYTLLFLIGGALALTTSIILGTGIPETAPSKSDPGSARRIPSPEPVPPSPGGSLAAKFLEPLRNRRFVHYSLGTLFLYLLMAQLVSTLPVYTVQSVGLRQDQLGHLYALNGLLVVFLQTTVTAFLSRFPVVGVQVVGTLVFAGAYFLVSQAGSLPVLLAIMFLITISEMAVTPGTVTIVSRLAPRETMGNYMGMFGLFSNSAWSLGPFLGGILLDLFIDQGVVLWGTVALFGVTSSVLYLGYRMRYGDVHAGGRVS